MFAAAGESGQKSAGGLNSVLRIPGETDYGVLNIFRPQIGAVRTRTGGGSRSGAGSGIGGSLAFILGYSRSFIHGIIKLTELAQHSTDN